MSKRKIDPEYAYQLNLQQYGESQRKKIRDFEEKYQPEMLTIQEALDIINDCKAKGERRPVLMAVFKAEIVAALSYDPIMALESITELREGRKIWLIKYWEEKYEIDLNDQPTEDQEEPNVLPWKYQIKIGFFGNVYHEEYHSWGKGIKYYDFPEAVFECIFKIKETE